MISDVRTFRAATISAALARVKRELGPDAVLLGTRMRPSAGTDREEVEITAAPPAAGPPRPAAAAATSSPVAGNPPSASGVDEPLNPSPAVTPRTRGVPESLYPFYLELVQNEVAARIAARIVRQAVGPLNQTTPDPAAIRAALRTQLERMIPAGGGVEVAVGGARRIALVGPPGSGKTTTLAKLAAQLGLRQKRRVAILSLDRHRLGGHEQIRRYAEIIGVPMAEAETAAQVRAACEALASAEAILMDTGGVALRDQPRRAQLVELLAAAQPDETHLVLPASMSAAAQQRAAEAFAPLGVSRLVLTGLDEAVGFGVVLNVLGRLRLPVSYLTTGPRVPQDLLEACSRRLAELILPPQR